MPSKIKILGPADRNKHGQACVLVQCSCGSPAFVTRADSVEQGRSTSCGFCRKGGRKRKAAQVLDPIPTSEVVPEVESTFKRGTPAWFDDEITRIDAAATASENRARYLEKEIAAQEVTD